MVGNRAGEEDDGSHGCMDETPGTITPAELSRELGMGPKGKQIRGFLRNRAMAAARSKTARSAPSGT